MTVVGSGPTGTTVTSRKRYTTDAVVRLTKVTEPRLGTANTEDANCTYNSCNKLIEPCVSTLSTSTPDLISARPRRAEIKKTAPDLTVRFGASAPHLQGTCNVCDGEGLPGAGAVRASLAQVEAGLR